LWEGGLGQGTCVRASSVMQWRARWNTSWDMFFFSYAAVSISIVQSRRAVTAGCNVLMAATASLHCFRAPRGRGGEERKWGSRAGMRPGRIGPSRGFDRILNRILDRGLDRGLDKGLDRA
jgi:hypothetical protein